jgi:hypothetical protein
MSRNTLPYFHPTGLDFSMDRTATGLLAATLKDMLVHIGLKALRSGDIDRVREITELLRERGLGDA